MHRIIASHPTPIAPETAGPGPARGAAAAAAASLPGRIGTATLDAAGRVSRHHAMRQAASGRPKSSG